MTNHEHDRELIMALAEGSLGATAADQANAAIAECDQCRTELGHQLAALSVLRDAPPVTMTDLEAARFRRDLDTALGHERTVVQAQPAAKRRFNWAPVFSVAAILLALVLIAPALQLLGGGDDAAEDAVSLQDLSVDEGADVDGGAPAEAPSSRSLDRVNSSSSESAEELAPSTSAFAGADDAGDAALELGERELLDDTLRDLREDLLEAPNDPAARIRALGYALLPESDDLEDRCLLEGAQFLDVDPADSYVLGELVSGDTVAFLTVHVDGVEVIVLAHDADSCEVLLQVPPR